MIGTGGFGSVYEATDSSGRKVAVKIIKDVSKNNYNVLKAYRELKIMHGLTQQKFGYAPELLSAFV